MIDKYDLYEETWHSFEQWIVEYSDLYEDATTELVDNAIHIVLKDGTQVIVTVEIVE